MKGERFPPFPLRWSADDKKSSDNQDESDDDVGHQGLRNIACHAFLGTLRTQVLTFLPQI